MWRIRLNDKTGFTLIEILMVIIIIGILAAVAATSLTTSVEDMRQVETEREMDMLASAIVGNPEIMSNGKRADFGYVGDIGAFPPNLQALYQNPGGLATWHGPYIALSFQQDSTGFRTDAWGTAYTYNGGTTITSTGSGASMTKTIARSTTDYLQNRLRGSISDAASNSPGLKYVDSVAIAITYPDGTGGTTQKVSAIDFSGNFTLDSLPVGIHKIQAIYLPANDTVTRYVTILPRHKGRIDLKFASAYFSPGSDSARSIPDTLYFSTAQTTTFLGLTINEDEIASYNGPADIGQLYLDGTTIFSENENIDALHILANGHIVLSTSSAATISGLSFQSDDLVEYDQTTGTAELIFDGGTVFSGNEDIDAVYFMNNGVILLSTTGSATIGALSFESRDIIKYNPTDGTAALFFDGSSEFTGNANIDAFFVTQSGHIILSVDGSGATIGSVAFGSDDLVDYDTLTGNASVYLNGNNFFETLPTDINALHIGAGVGATVDIGAGLVGYWKLDEASDTTASDASGYGNNGILHNMTGSEWTSGKINGALEFDGSNDYIEIPHADILNGDKQLTYSAWVYPHSWSGTRNIVSKSVHGGGSGRAQMAIFCESNRLYGRAETMSGRINISDTLPTLNTWAHVAVVFDSVSLKLYVNGSLVDSKTFSETSLKPTTDMLCISKRVGTSQYFFDGLIDEVRVYNIALAPAVIEALYNAGN